MADPTSRRPRPRHAVEPSGYPTREEVTCADPSRRRFLSQVGRGAGGLGLLGALGLPRLAHGQSTEVDFSVLDAHPSSASLAPAGPSSAAPAQEPPAAAMAPPAPAAPAPPATPVEVVTENRALWIEPGYLVLLRWERPVENLAAVAALEGASSTIAEYLGAHVAEMNDLHDIDRLHAHEHALAELLEGTVVPAHIETLHLDHDCNRVCGALGWTGPDPDVLPLPGIAPQPHFP